MSMAEATRNWRDNIPAWLGVRKPEPISIEPPLSVVQEMEILVRLAMVAGTRLERTSPTWAHVCQWAATELLETLAKHGSPERAKVLRELIALDEQPKPGKFPSSAPYIT